MDYLSLCLICKDENDYLPEWLDYHILMGVDRFYIYDNESQVSLRESLGDYIKRGWVVVLDIPGKAMQLYAYDHCLQTFGPNTFWMGFIDTDEFLVPKIAMDLKELLKDYEAYGGLAVSSLFFGSNGHKTRPAVGQIAGYTRRTHKTFKENGLVKSIVQPALTLMPNTPHDFTYKENAWCVNEDLLRVDDQRFPHHTEKIQLNHYFCRSEDEINLKMVRGRPSQSSTWPRSRFDVVNRLATYNDTSILQNLEAFFQKADGDSHGLVVAVLVEKMAGLALARCQAPMEIYPLRDALSFRAEIIGMVDLKVQTQAAENRKEFDEVKRLILLRLKMLPQNIILYTALSVNLLDLGDPGAAWQALSQAWKLSPNNNYAILGGMAFFFLSVGNFSMAEKTCRLILDLAPHDLVALGMLTHSLIGQGRFEEALTVGVPVVELSAMLGELPDRMGVFLVKVMADYMLTKKDYAKASRLWDAGVQCQPGDVRALLELTRVLLLAGDKPRARQRLLEASELAPENDEVLTLLKQFGVVTRPISSIVCQSKRSQ